MATSNELMKAGVLDLQEVTLCVLGKDGMKSFVPIMDQVSSFILTQSLFEQSVVCQFEIIDSVGHATRFNKSGYQGQEFISLKCKKPGEDGKQIDLQFWAYSIDEAGTNAKNDTASYSILCATKEKLISTYSEVNQSYSGTYSSAAKSIFDNYINQDSRKKKFFKKYDGFTFRERKLDLHESIVENQFIIPGKQPFDAIQMCARRCIGRKGSNVKASNIFIFYETVDGYNFHCIDDLIKDGIAGHPNPDLTFEYEPMRDKKDGEVSGKRFDRKIRDLISLKTSDTLMNGNGGVFQNTVLSIDTVGKTYKKQIFDYNTQFDNLTHLGNKPLVDNEYIENFAQPNYEHVYYKDSTKQNQYFENVIGTGLPFITHLHNLQLTFVIEGDTTIVPGMVLDIKLPEFSAINSNPTERLGSKYSGFWLVSTVTHEYTRDAFFTTISCLKDSISEAIGKK